MKNINECVTHKLIGEIKSIYSKSEISVYVVGSRNFDNNVYRVIDFDILFILKRITRSNILILKKLVEDISKNHCIDKYSVEYTFINGPIKVQPDDNYQKIHLHCLTYSSEDILNYANPYHILFWKNTSELLYGNDLLSSVENLECNYDNLSEIINKKIYEISNRKIRFSYWNIDDEKVPYVTEYERIDDYYLMEIIIKAVLWTIRDFIYFTKNCLIIRDEDIVNYLKSNDIGLSKYFGFINEIIRIKRKIRNDSFIEDLDLKSMVKNSIDLLFDQLILLNKFEDRKIISFICRGNVARSQLAAAYLTSFQEYYGASAGYQFIGDNYIPIEQIEPTKGLLSFMKDNRIHEGNFVRKEITRCMIDNSDVIILIHDKNDNITESIHEFAHVIWEIDDPKDRNPEFQREIFNQIVNKVKEYVKYNKW